MTSGATKRGYFRIVQLLSKKFDFRLPLIISKIGELLSIIDDKKQAGKLVNRGAVEFAKIIIGHVWIETASFSKKWASNMVQKPKTIRVRKNLKDLIFL